MLLSIFYIIFTFNWKRDWHNLGFEVLALPLEWRGCLNVQIQPECSLVCEAARAAGQQRQTGRETEVIWRDKTSFDMTCWSGSKHKRYSAEWTQEHRSLSFFVSFLFSFSSLYLSVFIALPLFVSVTAPPSVSLSHSLSLSISPSPSLSPHAVS